MFGEEKLGVGRETAKAYLRANPKLIEKIKALTFKKAEEGEPEEGVGVRSADNEVPPPSEE
jgi:hypothetical protein